MTHQHPSLRGLGALFAVALLLLLGIVTVAHAAGSSCTLFESAQVRPLALSSD